MRALVLVLPLIWLPLFGMAQSLPDPLSLYVNDYGDLIDPETEARITEQLKTLRKERGVEMTVVTVESRNDYGDFNAIEPFATALFNKWGVGNAKRNDGIMILVARSDREMRIELGAGYPPVFDDRVKTIIDYTMIPWFLKGSYSEGIEAGVTETIKRTRLEFTDEGYTTASRLRLEGLNIFDNILSGGLFAWIFGALGIAGGGAASLGIRRHLRNRPRTCDLCNRPMTRLSEEADDVHLSHGQQVEERLKSKDYDVWFCRHDDHVMIEGYKSWFSAFSACPDCGFRTLHSKRTVLESATTSHSGRARIDYSCRNCSHQHIEHVTIPKKSSSSSSSGSSFGGGSSSGGGASGSW